jgi:hypothetical protein
MSPTETILTGEKLIGSHLLFDKFIGVSLYRPSKKEAEVNAALNLIGAALTVVSDFVGNSDNSSKIVISCPATGEKPSISLSLTMVPYGHATSIKVSVDNFTPEVDINQYTYMVVRAGYRSNDPWHPEAGTEIFGCAIISTIIESPNPNGRTTFTGLVGNWFQDSLETQYHRFIFNGVSGSEKREDEGTFVTVNTLLTQTCTYLKIGLNVKGIPSDTLNKKIKLSGSSQFIKTFNTKYEVLKWMIDTIKGWNTALIEKMKTGSKEDLEVAEAARFFYSFQDNVLTICLLHEVLDTDSREIRYPKLSRITSVTFQGSSLMVTAPWLPSLKPGDLFHMDSKYIRGRPAPNIVMGLLTDSNNLYRVIQMDINFDTNGSQNAMRLQAISQSLYDGERAGLTALENLGTEYSGILNTGSGAVDDAHQLTFGAAEVIPPKEEEKPPPAAVQPRTWQELAKQPAGSIPKAKIIKLSSSDPGTYSGLTLEYMSSQSLLPWPSDMPPGNNRDYWRNDLDNKGRPFLLHVSLFYTLMYYQLLKDNDSSSLGSIRVQKDSRSAYFYTIGDASSVRNWTRADQMWHNPHELVEGDVIAFPELSDLKDLRRFEFLYRALTINKDVLNSSASSFKLDDAWLSGWWSFIWYVAMGGTKDSGSDMTTDFWNLVNNKDPDTWPEVPTQ